MKRPIVIAAVFGAVFGVAVVLGVLADSMWCFRLSYPGVFAVLYLRGESFTPSISVGVLNALAYGGACALVVALWSTRGKLMRWALRVDRRHPGRCTECDYDLTGNTSGVCPECASCCDPFRRTYHARGPWSKYLSQSVGALALILGAIFLPQPDSNAGRPAATYVVVIAAFLVISLWQTWKHQSRGYLLLDNKGIHAQRLGLSPIFIAWENVQSVRYSLVRGALQVEAKSPNGRWKIPASFFGGTTRALRATEEIRDWMNRSQADGNWAMNQSHR